MPNKKPVYTPEDDSVRAHIAMIQGIVQRMASNSANCKTWCITIISALLVLVGDKGRPQFAFLAFLPVLLFGYLDIYYLTLERGFINLQIEFIKTLHKQELKMSDLYAVKSPGAPFHLMWITISSPAILPFYATLAVLILFARYLVLT